MTATMTMPAPYDYAVVRVMPRVERGEFTNVGVIVFARTRGFLACRLDEPARVATRVRALAPTVDVEALHRHLGALASVCAGSPSAGPIAALPAPERFHWLITPRSAMIQCATAHAGVCDDAAATLDHLFAKLVAR